MTGNFVKIKYCGTFECRCILLTNAVKVSVIILHGFLLYLFLSLYVIRVTLAVTNRSNIKSTQNSCDKVSLSPSKLDI